MKPARLVILHTNDMHGRIDASWLSLLMLTQRGLRFPGGGNGSLMGGTCPLRQLPGASR